MAKDSPGKTCPHPPRKRLCLPSCWWSIFGLLEKRLSGCLCPIQPASVITGDDFAIALFWIGRAHRFEPPGDGDGTTSLFSFEHGTQVHELTIEGQRDIIWRGMGCRIVAGAGQLPAG